MDATYWAARLRALEDVLQASLDGIGDNDIGGDVAYRSGYRRGRESAYLRALSEVRRVRRDLLADAARRAT